MCFMLSWTILVWLDHPFLMPLIKYNNGNVLSFVLVRSSSAVALIVTDEVSSGIASFAKASEAFAHSRSLSPSGSTITSSPLTTVTGRRTLGGSTNAISSAEGSSPTDNCCFGSAWDFDAFCCCLFFARSICNPLPGSPLAVTWSITSFTATSCCLPETVQKPLRVSAR